MMPCAGVWTADRAAVLASLPASRKSCAGFKDMVGFLKLRYRFTYRMCRLHYSRLPVRIVQAPPRGDPPQLC